MHRARNRQSLLRKILRWLGGAVAIMVLVAAIWLLDHLRPRHAHFKDQYGPLEWTDVIEQGNPMSGVRSTTVHVRAQTGLKVAFRVLRPAAIEERVPLMILLGGHRTGSRAVELVGDPGEMAVAALDYPYHGPEKFRGIVHGASHLGEIKQGLLDTPPAVSVALDWLIQQPWVDTDRVELIGVSLGAPFAAVAGALDERFSRVWILHGGADNREWLENTLRETIPSPQLRAAMAWLLHLIAHGASFDTAYWVSRVAPRSVVIVGAANDESLSRQNIERLHTAAGEPKELLWTEGGHVKTNRPEVVRNLLDIVRLRVNDETWSRAGGPATDAPK